MYTHLRDLLFKLDAETSHEFSLDLIGATERLQLLKFFVSDIPANPVEVMGITFPNPVGLAAGLDKNGDYFNALGLMGFGFVEIGTITPKPQAGNSKPRLFRIPEAQAIINRMGFNNKGVDHLVERAKRRRYTGVLGINIGKNASTPVENAADDYVICMQKVYAHADYITVNVSSPNTQGLRDLQFGDSLNRLLEIIKVEQNKLQILHGRYVPVAVKIAPDMDNDSVIQVAKALLAQNIDGVIATNTTVGREGVEEFEMSRETGGLSGFPVRDKSTRVIRVLHSEVGDKLPIIGVGGITDGASAAEKINAGAKLVQIYSGFIYRGPRLISEATKAIEQLNSNAIKV
ncbi:MAG: quinone-dependent dihydroorotate dehydrogenase [Cellvibrio sp.]